MSPFDPPYKYIREMGFPTVTRLRQGITLGCIAHSFWLVAHEPVSEQFWDGATYLDDQEQGERWAVSFCETGAVAVFYSTETPRNPFPERSPPYDQSRYFKGMPEHLVPAKKRALRYMIDLDWNLGGPNAVVTSAMWADGAQFTAIEPWDDVFDHSGWACWVQLLPPEIALKELWDGMDLPGDGASAIKTLYERRIASPEPMIVMEPWEWETYREAAGGQFDSKRLAETTSLLTQLGISRPQKPN